MNSDCKETEIIVHLGYHLSSPGDSLSEGCCLFPTPHSTPHPTPTSFISPLHCLLCGMRHYLSDVTSWVFFLTSFIPANGIHRQRRERLWYSCPVLLCFGGQPLKITPFFHEYSSSEVTSPQWFQLSSGPSLEDGTT